MNRDSNPSPLMRPAGLVKEFLKLSEENRAKLISVARQKASLGICFLCAWIVEQKRFEEFPRDSRIQHLIICCSGC